MRDGWASVNEWPLVLKSSWQYASQDKEGKHLERGDAEPGVPEQFSNRTWITTVDARGRFKMGPHHHLSSTAKRALRDENRQFSTGIVPSIADYFCPAEASRLTEAAPLTKRARTGNSMESGPSGCSPWFARQSARAPVPPEVRRDIRRLGEEQGQVQGHISPGHIFFLGRQRQVSAATIFLPPSFLVSALLLRFHIMFRTKRMQRELLTIMISYMSLVLTLSCPKIPASAICLFSGGPRVNTIAEQPHSGSCVGLLFLPSDQALAAERVSDCSLLFYVISGKVLVKVSLLGRGGKTVHSAPNKRRHAGSTARDNVQLEKPPL